MEFTQVRLLRPLTVGAVKREKGDVVDVSAFDHRMTVEGLISTKAVEPVKAGVLPEKGA